MTQAFAEGTDHVQTSTGAAVRLKRHEVMWDLASKVYTRSGKRNVGEEGGDREIALKWGAS